MKLTLIGMSNIGKSHWSKKLEAHGFLRFGCDEMIEKSLEKELKTFGYAGICDMAKWMGQPYDSQYSDTSRRYLLHEQESLEQICSHLSALPDDTNAVIDTTGSFIYADNTIMKRLKEATTVVFLETPDDLVEELYTSYIQNPKPVIWDAAFHKQDGESDMDALARCYPRLLGYRTTLYKWFADVTLAYSAIRNPGYPVDAFLHAVKQNATIDI